MGGSGKWIKSLIGLKKNQSNDSEKGGGKNRKWKLWRSASGGIAVGLSKSVKGGGNLGDSDGSESSFLSDSALAAAMATVIRAPHKDFVIVKKEWAAIRIQAAFRGFLARRALRALKAVVRIQAIFRGRRVRMQAAITLKYMQSLFRVQARVRSQCNQTSIDGDATKGSLVDSQANPIKQAESGWCDSPGTVDEVRFKLKMRQIGAIKRERAIAYAQQKLSPNSRTRKVETPNKIKATRDSAWLERWMANKPWENRLVGESHTDASGMTPNSKKHEDYDSGSFTELSSVNIRRNNMSTRISTRGPISCQLLNSSSEPYTDYYRYDDSTSHSSMSTSETLGSNQTPPEEGHSKKPNYMNFTKSITAKAKQRNSSYLSQSSMQRNSTDSLQVPRKSSPLSRARARRSADCDLYSVDLCKDLYPPSNAF